MPSHNHRRERKQTKGSVRNIASVMTIAAIGITLSSSIRRDASRTFVRAAFTSGNGASIISARRTSSAMAGPTVSVSRNFHSGSSSANSFKLCAQQSRREMSTAADQDVDQELESTLDEILGEALAEAENPAAPDGQHGHIEGSHPFPKELVEQVSFDLIYVFELYIINFTWNCMHL